MTTSPQDRPLVVIAERQDALTEDASPLSLLVPFYRRRFQILGAWLVLLAASVVLFPASGESTRWFFSIAFVSAPLSQVQGQGIDGLAGALSGAMSAMDPSAVSAEKLTMDFSRLGSGAKAEVLRDQLNVSAESGDTAPPASLETLRKTAVDWVTRQEARFESSRTAIEQVLTARADALARDPMTTQDSRMAAEFALAQVRASADVPPRWIVSAISPVPTQAGPATKTWTLRLAGSLLAALALSGLLIAWSKVAEASRLDSVR
ncbi:MAG: hypothetical protein ACO3DS_00445 [Phycisphaerales bacterium]